VCVWCIHCVVYTLYIIVCVCVVYTLYIIVCVCVMYTLFIIVCVCGEGVGERCNGEYDTAYVGGFFFFFLY